MTPEEAMECLDAEERGRRAASALRFVDPHTGLERFGTRTDGQLGVCDLLCISGECLGALVSAELIVSVRPRLGAANRLRPVRVEDRQGNTRERPRYLFAPDVEALATALTEPRGPYARGILALPACLGALDELRAAVVALRCARVEGPAL